MKFDREIETIYKYIAPNQYFDGICPFCSSKEMKIRSSRIRTIQDLGTTSKKVIIRLEVQTIECKIFSAKFSPDHPAYPSKYEYSKDIMEYALTRYNYHNISGNAIARDLALLHNVQVSEATVYS